MSVSDYAAKYGEIDGLFKKYCDKKKRESKSLRKQLEEEITTNVELRKYIAILESKLLSERDAVANLERQFRDATSLADASAKERDRQLREVASDLAARLQLVEKRERECAERTAALELSEEQFCLRSNSFESAKMEFEHGFDAFRRALGAERQHAHAAVDVAEDCLCEIKRKDDSLVGQQEELEYESRLIHHRMMLELQENSFRETIGSHEFEARCSLITTFFHGYKLELKSLLSSQKERESQLSATTDLLRLHEVEFSSRVRKERDLCQEERSKVEALREEFILDCRNALRQVSEVLDSISEGDTTSVRLDLESKLLAMLELRSHSTKQAEHS